MIQPNVRIGDNTVLWSGNHIGHDTTIGNHCFIASHAVISGGVTIGDYCFVGVNATFRDGVTVAPRCVIGADALIMKDTEEGGVYAVRGTEPLEKKSWDIEPLTRWDGASSGCCSRPPDRDGRPRTRWCRSRSRRRGLASLVLGSRR